jgi:hypothetical protein
LACIQQKAMLVPLDAVHEYPLWLNAAIFLVSGIIV